MAPSCIDHEPPELTGTGSSTVLHLTKVLPSGSGVARHAAAFDRALGALGRCVTLGLANEARDTQRLSMIIRTTRRARRAVRRERPDLVVVDLSGRALAEFFGACVVAGRRRRPKLWLVVHDPPELVGQTFLVAGLDRKGGRRLGVALSRWLSPPVERWLLGRVDGLLAFSELGASILRERQPGHAVWAVPLPVELMARRVKERVVYCPANLVVAGVEPTLAALGRPEVAEEVRVRVGSMAPTDRREVERVSSAMGVASRLDFTGHLDQDALDESFATAAVVVRDLRPDGRADNVGAASGPLVQALAAGCAVISTDVRGSRRCVELAGVDLSQHPERLTDEVVRLLGDPEAIERLGDAAIAHVESCHVPEAVARHLASIWRATDRSAATD